MSEPCNLVEMIVPIDKLRIFNQELKPSFDSLPNACDIMNNMTNMLMPVTPPILAIVKVIQCVIQIVEGIDAIPDSILSLDPSEPIELIASAISCLVNNVINFLPQFWVVQLIIDLVVMFIRMIDCLITVLRKFVYYNTEFEDTTYLARLAGSSPLLGIGNCGKKDVVYSQEIIIDGMFAPITTFIGIFNVFYELIVSVLSSEAIRNLVGYTGDPDDFYLPFNIDMQDILKDSSAMLALEYLEDLKRDALIPMLNAFISVGLV